MVCCQAGPKGYRKPAPPLDLDQHAEDVRLALVEDGAGSSAGRRTVATGG